MLTNNQVKGKILEQLLKVYLEKQGYTIIHKNMRKYYGIKEDSIGLLVKGRGAWHQIDVLGQFQFQIPFIYPLRLICEAKCWKKKVDLPVVRNFASVLKDISENYFIERPKELEFKQRFRFTDCGAIFSTSGFTKNAQMFAYAHGIYLVNVGELLPKVMQIFHGMEKDLIRLDYIDFTSEVFNKSKTGKKFREILKEKVKEIYCYFGLAAGIYPICITSKEKFPENKFYEKDEERVRIFYRYEEGRRRKVSYFILKLDEWIGRFQLPEYLWENYIRMPEFREAMRSMKEKHLNFIDIPMIIKGMRRIIRLTLDKPWIESLRSKEKAHLKKVSLTNFLF